MKRSLDMRYKITSPRVFIDTLESFFDEHGGHQRVIASAFGTIHPYKLARLCW